MNGNGRNTLRTAQELSEDLDPEDGFHIMDLGSGADHELALVFREGGDLTDLPGTSNNSHTLLKITNADAREKGRVSRTLHLLRALCRYVNTGGSTDELRSLSETMCLAMGRVSLDLDGFFLLLSEFNDEAGFEHVYVREGSSDAIRVVENKFVDTVPLEELEREL